VNATANPSRRTPALKSWERPLRGLLATSETSGNGAEPPEIGLQFELVITGASKPPRAGPPSRLSGLVGGGSSGRRQ